MRYSVLLVGWCLLLASVAMAQDGGDEVSEKLREMVTKGRGDALQRELRDGRSARDFELIATAYANQGRRARRAEDREAAYTQAAEYYEKWIAAAGRATGVEPAKRTVNVIQARVAYAGMILSSWSASDLDAFEITAGLRVEREPLLARLQRAIEQYEAAWKELKPLLDDLRAREDEYFALGIYDTINTLRLDVVLSRSWAHYFVGMVTEDPARRTRAYAAAEQGFRELVDSAYVGEMIYQCYLGLGMTLREQRRYDDAARALESAADQSPLPLQIQARYEHARLLLAQERFDEARAMVEPLAEQDVERLTAEQTPATFYFNLAKILDARIDLLQANQLSAAARGHRSEQSMRRQAENLRERGVTKLRRLAQMGGSWPAVAQLHIAASIDPAADPKTLSPTELLYSARALVAGDNLLQAKDRLREAATRDDLEPDLLGDVLYELGVVHYRVNELREAAMMFERLARDVPNHEKAATAVTYAYQLWAKLAERSDDAGDYRRLAATLRMLLERFPQHPEREQAEWWLPVALQSAGQVDEARREFAKVPQGSKHWEEAQYRQALCAKLTVEAQRDTLDDEAYAKAARAAADELMAYVAAAAQRGEQITSARRFMPQAILSAAELRVSSDVGDYAGALAAIDDFESRFDKDELMGRVLGIRIRAHRGLRQFDQAAKLLNEYLAAVPASQAGSVLTSLAGGMQQEVQRLVDAGQDDAARALAGEAVATFEQLSTWVAADEERAKFADVVRFGEAKMRMVAGQFDAALELARQLVAADPQNGNYQRLYAQILTHQLGADAPASEVAAAQEAWAKLLLDRTLRQRAPQQFWEARYNWLRLKLRQGAAADVAKAIGQEAVWYPELGGPEWRPKFETLRAEAEAQLPTDPNAG